MFSFLLAVHTLIAAALVGVILLQRSEGGGLGMGGSPSGLMSARGAADLLTRATAVLAAAFVAMCILLAVLAARQGNRTLDSSLKRETAPATGLPSPTQPPALPNPGATEGAAPAAEAPAAAATPTGAQTRPSVRIERGATTTVTTPAAPARPSESRAAPPPTTRQTGGNASAPANATGSNRLPGVVSAPSIPAGQAKPDNGTGPNN